MSILAHTISGLMSGEAKYEYADGDIYEGI